MEDQLVSIAEKYLSVQFSTDLKTLLAPIPGASGAGEALGGSTIYREIRLAREEEDASLPMGAWERELKRADWNSVSRLCVEALSTRSKDLQLAVWLMEAEIHRHGFEALAPSLVLIGSMCADFWSSLHPLDHEHRENLFRWMADKLCLPLRRVSFTATGSGTEYGWADWEQAQRNEQIRASLGKGAESALEGATLGLFSAALSCTPSPKILAVQVQLSDALASLGRLDGILEKLLGDESPIFNALRDLIENISLMLASEARKRGISQSKTVEETPAPVSESSPISVPSDEGNARGTDERQRLYGELSRLATRLAGLEPHSPVPYLIRRAVEWGALDTAQLYNEVFVRCGGQLNIFELLGLEDQIAAQESQTGV